KSGVVDPNRIGWGGAGGHRIFIKSNYFPPESIGYMHLSSFLVIGGMHVQAGDPIGRVGTSGHSSGPHLHVQVMNDTTSQDLNPVETLGNIFALHRCDGGIDALPGERISSSTLRPRVSNSLDPNEKAGAHGIGLDRFVSSQRELPYTV